MARKHTKYQPMTSAVGTEVNTYVIDRESLKS